MFNWRVVVQLQYKRGNEFDLKESKETRVSLEVGVSLEVESIK